MASDGAPSFRFIAHRPFKRSLFGYRPREVDEALDAAEARLTEGAAWIEAQASELAARQRRVDDLERVADRLSERIVVRERELAAVRAELARLRAEGEDGVRSLALLADELEAVRRQARGQATRMRLRALSDAAEIGERMAELARRPGEVRERVLDSIQEAIGRIGTEDDQDDEVPAGSNGHSPKRAGRMFDGVVEVEIGPLSDFSKLVGFEDAAGGIGATSEISVKRFTQGRATLEMNLAEPVALLHELEERAPFEFRVRDTRADRVVLDVDEE